MARVIGLFRWVLPPEAAAKIDLDLLESVPCSFVSDELTERLADLVFGAPLRHDPTVWVYFLLEHQSTADPTIIDRLDEYVRLIESWIAQNQPDRAGKSLVVPIVVHQGPTRWRGPRRKHDTSPAVDAVPTLAPFVADFGPLIVDLAEVTDAELRTSPIDPAGTITLGALREASSNSLVFEQWDRWADPDRLSDSDLRAILTYSIETSDLTPQELKQHFNRANPTRSSSNMTSTADQLRQQGEEQGLAQGRLAAFRETVVELTINRFGYIEPTLQARVDQADEHDLQAAIRHLLTVDSQDDLLT